MGGGLCICVGRNSLYLPLNVAVSTKLLLKIKCIKSGKEKKGFRVQKNHQVVRINIWIPYALGSPVYPTGLEFFYLENQI